MTTQKPSPPVEQAIDEAMFLATQSQLYAIAVTVVDMPLDGVVDACTRVHVLGPVMDPTAYKAKVENVKAVEQLARALRSFQRVARRLADRPEV